MQSPEFKSQHYKKEKNSLYGLSMFTHASSFLPFSAHGFCCLSPFRSQTGMCTEQEINLVWVPVAHACNPRYLGGWHQEDHSSRPAWAKKLVRPYVSGKKVRHSGMHYPKL
jgi:hypothetical protein